MFVYPMEGEGEVDGKDQYQEDSQPENQIENQVTGGRRDLRMTLLAPSDRTKQQRHEERDTHGM